MAINLSAQNEPDFAWGKLVGANGNHYTKGITTDNNGNIYYTGVSHTNNINFGNGITLTKGSGEPYIGYLAKFNENGLCIWAKNFTPQNNAYPKNNMIVDEEGNIYLTIRCVSNSNEPQFNSLDGYIFPNIEGTTIYHSIAKLDNDGNLVWLNPIPIQYPAPNLDNKINKWVKNGHISIRFDTQNNLLVTGLFQQDIAFYSEHDTISFVKTDFNEADMYLATYSKDGDILNVDTLSTGITLSLIDSRLYPSLTLELDDSGNLYRYIRETRTITIYDPQLNITAEHELSAHYLNYPSGNGSADEITRFTIDKLGNMYLTAQFSGNNNIGGTTLYQIGGFTIPKYGNNAFLDGVLVKLSRETFSGEWYVQNPQMGSEYFTDLETDELNNIYITGDNHGKGMLLKYNSNGQQIWVKDLITGTATPLTQQMNSSVTPENVILTGNGGNILCVGRTQNRIQIDEEVIEFPNVTRGFLIQYGICDTEKPLLSAIPSTSFCAGDSIMLTASGSTGDYIWNTGETTSSIYTNTPSTYHVIAQQDSVCYGKSSSIIVDESPLPDIQITVSDSVICMGEEVTLSVSGSNDITWEDNIENDVPFIPSTTKEYFVTVTDSNGCSSVASQLVSVLELPNNEVSQQNNILTSLESSIGTTYQWIDCENGNLPISGAVNSTFKPTENGEYAVVLTNSNGCSSTSDCYVINTLDVKNNPLLDKQITLYPNPTSSNIIIQTDLETKNIVVLDLQGKKLLESTSKQVDLSRLSSGIYLIKVELPNNENWTSKVIKE